MKKLLLLAVLCSGFSLALPSAARADDPGYSDPGHPDETTIEMDAAETVFSDQTFIMWWHCYCLVFMD